MSQENTVYYSDELSDIIDDNDNARRIEQIEKHIISVIVDRTISGNSKPIVGTLGAVEFNPVDPNVEIKCMTSDALDVVDSNQQVINGFEFHYGERIVKMPGPFKVVSAIISNVDPRDQLCLLTIKMIRQ